MVSLGLTWFHLVSLGFTWSHLVSLGFTRFHSVSLGLTWSHLDSLGLTWTCKISAQTCTRLSISLLKPTCLCTKVESLSRSQALIKVVQRLRARTPVSKNMTLSSQRLWSPHACQQKSSPSHNENNQKPWSPHACQQKTSPGHNENNQKHWSPQKNLEPARLRRILCGPPERPRDDIANSTGRQVQPSDSQLSESEISISRLRGVGQAGLAPPNLRSAQICKCKIGRASCRERV